MNDIFDGEFFGALKSLKLAVKMRQNSGMSGARRSLAKGSSVEFSDFREYISGDDTRRVDWNAYGRLDRLFVKLFTEEKEASFRIMVDVSKSMDYGQGKKAAALRIAGMFSYMVLTNLDRLYLTTMNQTCVKTTKGMSGGYSFQRVLSELSGTVFEGETNLVGGILSQPLVGRGVTILISDFFDCDDLKEALAYLAYKKQEIILIQVLDEEEINPGVEGYVNLIDSENGSQCRVMVTSKIRREYEAALVSFKERLRGLAVNYRADYALFSSGEPLEQWIAKIGKVGMK